MHVWNAARWKYNTQKIAKKSPSEHHRTTLSGYIFATKARIDNRKKLLSSNMSSRCPHNMVNLGPLAAEIVSLIWGSPANFNGFRVLAALLHSTLVVGVSQSLQRWTEGATYIRQGGHHVGHWRTFLVRVSLHYTVWAYWSQLCKHSSIITLSGRRADLGLWSAESISLATLNMRSHGTEVAGIHKSFCACMTTFR